MKVIGFAGQLSSGKDTAADYLADKLGLPWKRIGFAHAVKKVFMDTFDVSWDFIEEWKRKDEIPPGFNTTVRKGLQYIGDGFRQIRQDIWIETAFRKDEPKILSDVRYLNEARAIRKHGGLTVLVWRKGYVNNDLNPSEAQIKPSVLWCANHGFEGKIPDDVPDYVSIFDCFLRNDGDLEDFYRKIDELIVPLVKEKWS